MNSLLLIAVIFFGGLVWVGADFFVEIKAWVNPTSSRQQPVQATFLYECVGIPAGLPAIETTESRCTPVNTYERKTAIYARATFYSLFHPDLQGHQIRLIDRGILAYEEWTLGYLNHAIDHPNFGEPREDDFVYFQNRVRMMGVPNIIPLASVNGLAFYYSQYSVLAYTMKPAVGNVNLMAFTTALYRIMSAYYTSFQIQNEARAEQLRAQVGSAMKVALQKMIDPCSVLIEGFAAAKYHYCVAYCHFLNVVTLNFGPASSRCSSITGGHCQGVVCTCVRASHSPLMGCQTSPMQMCNNAMRVKLDL